MICTESFAQYNVPYGINYQAVARDNYGNELANRKISVKFSVISGDPLGTAVYQEVHQNIITSAFGVFSLVIGQGIPTGSASYGELSQVQWDKAPHYLKVEVKFENAFMDMGTMPFLSVPYALYAQKSLEPGPTGPKGDPGPKGDAGDPASDKQTLSFDQSTLNISGGNSVPLTSLLQNLTITTSPEGNYLGISRGNSVLLSTAEADGDPANEIQDLVINSDILKITKNSNATSWSLAKYLQSLNWDPVTRKLGLSDNSVTIDLSDLKNDADADAANELQTLNYNKNTGDLTISSKNTINLENPVGFKAKKSISQTGLVAGATYPFINPDLEFNDGAGYDTGTGSFTAPMSGIYTFCVYYRADGIGSARTLSLLKNGTVYEILGSDIVSNSELTKWVTMKLDQGNVISLTINTGVSTYSGTGSFVGYKVN
jgi:hypothetical protein